MSLVTFQMWLVQVLATVEPIRRFMHTTWGWPAAESAHFIGLTLLIGTVGLFDLRLLGLARPIPIGALHRLIPWGVIGFLLTAASGMLFLMTEPDQYVYNPSFHVKAVAMLAAGLNALAFYLTSYRRVTGPGASAEAPRLVKAIAIVSLTLWLTVLVAGRLLTFYRPFPCEPPMPGSFVAYCLPDYR